MYIYMGMSFNSQMDVPDFGSITMNFVGTKELGYVEEGYKRFRKYTFQSTDFSKLALITNAIDGSEAFAVDTGTTYVLYNKAWYEKTVGITSRDIAEILGDITSIDYQIVSTLPITGIKGTIYLVSHNHGLNDAYDEYIWTNNTYEKIGNTDIDLSSYIPVVTGANNKVPKFNSEGKLTSSGFELNKTVPSDAIFTDTTYTTMTGATNNANGTSGLVPAPNTDAINSVLTGNGTWKIPSSLISILGGTQIPVINNGIVTNATEGLVSFPTGTGKNDYVLTGDGKWKTINTIFSLPNIQKTDLSFADSLVDQSEFDAIKSITTDNKGRVTGVITGTYTLSMSDYLPKSDIVTLTAAEYEALVTKTAPYYFITDV